MEVRVQHEADPGPFLRAQDHFETQYDLDRPVYVDVRADPDERTRNGHYPEYHQLVISEQAASSAMASELALHEYAHMYRYEQGHPSHHQSTAEALFLILAGRSVERRVISHCHQIANHCKDIYADDITLGVTPSEKFVPFFESSLATAIINRPAPAPMAGGTIASGTDSPEITAVNAAFALALLERHDAIEDNHALYSLAETAAARAPGIDLEAFREHFRSFMPDPTESEYRRLLVDCLEAYIDACASTHGPAAD